MSDGLLWHRIQFAFTITFHYLFPQLTMGLGTLFILTMGVASVLLLRGRLATAWVRPNLFSGLGTRPWTIAFVALAMVRGLGSPPVPEPGPGAGRLPRLVRVPPRACGNGAGGELPVLAPVDLGPLRQPHRDEFRLRPAGAGGGAGLVGRRDHPGRWLLHPPVPLGAGQNLAGRRPWAGRPPCPLNP